MDSTQLLAEKAIARAAPAGGTDDVRTASLLCFYGLEWNVRDCYRLRLCCYNETHASRAAASESAKKYLTKRSLGGQLNGLFRRPQPQRTESSTSSLPFPPWVSAPFGLERQGCTRLPRCGTEGRKDLPTRQNLDNGGTVSPPFWGTSLKWFTADEFLTRCITQAMSEVRSAGVTRQNWQLEFFS